eukprot:1677018-Prymnesium_polylepis.1
MEDPPPLHLAPDEALLSSSEMYRLFDSKLRDGDCLEGLEERDLVEERDLLGLLTKESTSSSISFGSPGNLCSATSREMRLSMSGMTASNCSAAGLPSSGTMRSPRRCWAFSSLSSAITF